MPQPELSALSGGWDRLMLYLGLKILLTAILIVLITELAKMNDRWGGLVAAMPLTTFFVISWMYADGAADRKIASHISYTLLYVLPTLPMFVIFPFVINRAGFFAAILASIVITGISVVLMDMMVRPFGIKLL